MLLPSPCDAELVGAGEDAAALAGAALTAEGGDVAGAGVALPPRTVGLAEDAVPEVKPALVDGSTAGTLSGACGIGEGLAAALGAAEAPCGVAEPASPEAVGAGVAEPAEGDVGAAGGVVAAVGVAGVGVAGVGVVEAFAAPAGAAAGDRAGDTRDSPAAEEGVRAGPSVGR